MMRRRQSERASVLDRGQQAFHEVAVFRVDGLDAGIPVATADETCGGGDIDFDTDGAGVVDGENEEARRLHERSFPVI